MKKLVLVGLLSAGLVLTNVTAQAGHDYYYGPGIGYRYYGHIDDDAFLIAAGIIAGTLLLGWLLAPRPHVQPAPLVRAPAYRPTCYRDRVYRYLPDGRIQWGIRTRCF